MSVKANATIWLSVVRSNYICLNFPRYMKELRERKESCRFRLSLCRNKWLVI